MRRASTLAALLVAAGGLLLADAASAQSDPRYLSWSGRGDATPPQSREPAGPVPVRRDTRRPNPVIPHGGVAARESAPRGLTPAPGPARRSLTPANAWLRPPASTPEPAPAAVIAQPPAAHPAAAPQPRPVPEYLPDQGGGGQPAPAEVIYPVPAQPVDVRPEGVSDPMAPRRDALIFQMQASTPPPVTGPAPETAPSTPRSEAPQPRPVMEVVNSGEAPPRQAGGRYYSVHRQNGRDPDPLSLPAPTYVDGLVVSEIDTIASQDLAAPEDGPTLIRDRNGNMRAAPAPSDGDHQ
ncbi:hypothetical protein N0B44_07710 [Roseibacterium beibuensis]|uniref:hypothetical protein n=1 Tax=[Roseibacterium] beibuensis TaxID=1193142 RepID=UPI00217F06FE|nr:hypothetical protein [Roseibacterium beibuensis]MCS6622791.1 hypothetical protein [Roseibacterium beibuensis]